MNCALVHPGARKQARDAEGFTLVEILVVMALLSAVMLGLGAAMRTMAQTETRVDTRLQRADEMRVATGFLTSTLERVSVRKSEVSTRSGASLYLFVGAPDALMWVGVMPARFGAGGRYFFKLAVEQQGADRSLVIRFAPWSGAAVFPDWNRAASRILVPSVTAWQLEYGDDVDPAVRWRPDWPFADRMPPRVRITVATLSETWPPLVVPLRALPANEGGRGGFTMGPE